MAYHTAYLVPLTEATVNKIMDDQRILNHWICFVQISKTPEFYYTTPTATSLHLTDETKYHEVPFCTIRNYCSSTINCRLQSVSMN